MRYLLILLLLVIGGCGERRLPGEKVLYYNRNYSIWQEAGLLDRNEYLCKIIKPDFPFPAEEWINCEDIKEFAK